MGEFYKTFIKAKFDADKKAAATAGADKAGTDEAIEETNAPVVGYGWMEDVINYAWESQLQRRRLVQGVSKPAGLSCQYGVGALLSAATVLGYLVCRRKQASREPQNDYERLHAMV